MCKREKIIIFICFIVIIVCIFLLIFVNTNEYHFIKPEFDKNSINGNLDVESLNSYSSFTYNDNYIVSLCGEPEVKNNKLYLYITSNENNNVYVKVRVYKNNRIVGESGLIKPNEYLEYIDVNNVKSNDKISLKVMGYDSDYHSAGVINMNLVVN